MRKADDYRIYEKRTSYVLGFHGCNKETAEALLKNETPTFWSPIKEGLRVMRIRSCADWIVP
jgi:hypothetical protein